MEQTESPATGDRGGGLGSGPDQDREEQTGALLREQEEVQRGGECRVEAEGEAPRAAVYFQCQEVRERVIARKNHEIIVSSDFCTDAHSVSV
ncbi:hypothetical protein CgunFtcFv8_027632 [Champsocephalus gunnari]|uniref:PAR14-like first RRM domain-containing protein n=1 Tax=Champsocephalus gunnari TaxID=52237 RepID=A0AAN8I2K4_CHAGU|nr:hypothetical protein CgunFtcFv8_027631 [Champsocephalus gunnari]KAK5936248.1 hypothetical protein CgunFtcFv8_027632 [Champsocephalus gunnari]